MDFEYSPREVTRLLAEHKLQLVDVRQANEYEAGRIAEARLIELRELAARAGELDPAQPLVFYCRSGARSAMATQAFREAGYEAYNMVGGLLQWQAEGLPLEPQDGHVAGH